MKAPVIEHLRSYGGDAVDGLVYRPSTVDKNVCANADDIAAMYGDNIEHFMTMKRRLDPDGLIRNAFFDRVCPGRVLGASPAARQP